MKIALKFTIKISPWKLFGVFEILAIVRLGPSFSIISIKKALNQLCRLTIKLSISNFHNSTSNLLIKMLYTIPYLYKHLDHWFWFLSFQ